MKATATNGDSSAHRLAVDENRGGRARVLYRGKTYSALVTVVGQSIHMADCWELVRHYPGHVRQPRGDRWLPLRRVEIRYDTDGLAA